MPARARAGRGRLYGRRRQVGSGDTTGSVRDDTAVPVPPVAPVGGHDPELQPDKTSGGADARRLENLIIKSIAKGVELGIAKALSAIESRPASANPGTEEGPVTVAGLSSSTIPAQPRFSIRSAAHSVPAAAASFTAVRDQPSATSSSDASPRSIVSQHLHCHHRFQVGLG